MHVETATQMRAASAHLTTAVGMDGDNRQEVARAFDALQDVAEMIYRRTGSPSLSLAEREATAYAAQAVIRAARRGTTVNYSNETLLGAIALLDRAGYGAE